MRQGKPFVELTSTRPAKDVALCIAKRWENSGYGGTPSVTFRPSETGYVVAVRNEWIGSTQLLVDIDDVAPGSSARYFKGAVVAEGVFDKAVIECQEP
jgi:hypothetical protein